MRPVAEIASRLKPEHATPNWIETIRGSAALYLQSDPSRPGAQHLQLAIEQCRIAMACIEAGEAAGAAMAAMSALQAAWLAELADGDGRAVIRAGIGTRRGGAKGGKESSKTRSGDASKRAAILVEAQRYSGPTSAKVRTIASKTGAT
ncbi:MAG: hypothetical protein AB7S98_14135, partial [Burkholderiaceae bacterium]